jgi:hypothetical protein
LQIDFYSCADAKKKKSCGSSKELPIFAHVVHFFGSSWLSSPSWSSLGGGGGGGGGVEVCSTVQEALGWVHIRF